MPLLLIAIALLAAGLLGQLIRLPDEARLARGSATLAIPFLALFGLAPWVAAYGLVAIGLLIVLAVAGWRSGVWPLAASLSVVAACVGVVASQPTAWPPSQAIGWPAEHSWRSPRARSFPSGLVSARR